MIRFSGPLISQLFDVGVTIAAGAAVATFVGGSVLAYAAQVIGARVGLGRTVLLLAAAIVVLRVLVPFLAGDTLVLYGLITLALTLALLVVSFRSVAAAGGPPAAIASAAVGAMIAVLEQGLLHTWDAVWRSDLLAIAATAALCLSLLYTAWRGRKDQSDKHVRGLWAFGLWMSITAFSFANLAFVSSQTGYHLSVAIVLAAVGLGAGSVLASRGPNIPQPAVVAIGAATVLAVWTLMYFQGPVLVVMGPVAIAGTTYLASRAMTSAAPAPASGWRVASAAAVFGLLTVLPFMLVQLDYDIPLGVPHLMVMVAAAAALMVGSAISARGLERRKGLVAAAVGFRRRAGVLGIASVLVAALALMTFNGGGGSSGEPPTELRVMSWNLHYGVTPGLSGGPDAALGAIADEIRSHNPDVVIIQEMTRGWILAGGTDMLQVLADELDMGYVYVGAHDHQFGNAILSRYELKDVEAHKLPYGAGPQGRSAIVATIDTANGPIQFTSIHLQHKDDDATRVAEAEEYLKVVTPAPAALVAGDFNDTPDSDVVALMLKHYSSAQDDSIGNANTYVGSDFQDRIDYVFYTGLKVTEFAIGDSGLSDHLSLNYVVSIP